MNNIKQDWSNFVGFCDAGEKTPNSQIQDVYTYTCKYNKNDRSFKILLVDTQRWQSFDICKQGCCSVYLQKKCLVENTVQKTCDNY